MFRFVLNNTGVKTKRYRMNLYLLIRHQKQKRSTVSGGADGGSVVRFLGGPAVFLDLGGPRPIVMIFFLSIKRSTKFFVNS